MKLKAVLFEKQVEKAQALKKLIEEASQLTNRLSGEEIRILVEEREKIATTLVSDSIAFPHAVKQGIDENLMIIGISREPVLWSRPDQYVKVIILFVGGTSQHLESMSTMAKVLRDPLNIEKLNQAGTEIEIEELLLQFLKSTKAPKDSSKGQEFNSLLLKAAIGLQKEIQPSALAIIDDVFSSNRSADLWYKDYQGYVLTTKECCLSETNIDSDKIITIPDSELIFVENELKRLTMEGYFKGLNSLILLFGDVSSNDVSTLRIIDLKNREGIRFMENIPFALSQRVLQLAREIGSQGREGKPVGCLFVIGEEENLKAYTHQLIINPFNGYPEEERNIIDPSLEETIKEFSQIDGAYIINPQGTILSAGTYIAISPQKLEHHPGEGARHASARGISAVTDCLAIAVSESTGRVSVYAKGRRIL